MSAISPPASPPVSKHTTWQTPRSRRYRAAAVLLAVLAVLISLVTPSPQAQAASLGPSFGSDATGYVGAFVAEPDGRNVYCIDILAASPIGQPTSPPVTVTSVSSYNGAQLTDTELARLNYVLSKWGDSSDPRIT